MARIKVEITERDLKELVVKHLREVIGDHFESSQVKIEVKSKQNYRSEWEVADFRAIYEGDV